MKNKQSKMGRPIVGKAKDSRIGIRIDEDTKNKLDKICELTKESKSKIIRELIIEKYDDLQI